MTKEINNYLDLTFIIGENKLYDKRDVFKFYLVSFPFMSSKIPFGPSYVDDKVFTFRSLSDMQDAAHIMVTLDIVINSLWTKYFLSAIKSID